MTDKSAIGPKELINVATHTTTSTQQNQ